MDTRDQAPHRRRMTGAGRRQQMLDRAMTIVAEEGAAALTLARLAEACGVTKPIAYQHFGTREGLLAELFLHLGARHEAAAAVALSARAAGTLALPQFAHAIAAAFIDCAIDNGPLYTEIAAALAAAGAAHQAVRIGFVQRYAAAIRPVVALDDAAVHAFTVAYVGAAEHLSEAVLQGHVTRERAIATLCTMLVPVCAMRSAPPVDRGPGR
ncbi:TetR family transcriptional regulator [Zavarzinia sp. CC-PAN008]|uniref:TetR family transcriptional regulator n=1 Tax=Zavarzinia sp. CC-PAN008 TaxID=3243332 RepID=UPI003F74539B